jgi:DNA-binding PadR family transcriptional regulator
MKEYFVPAIGFLLLLVIVAGALWDGSRYEKQVDAVLGHLLMRGESYGHEMVKESNGVLGRGTVYVLLGQLEQQGLLKSREEGCPSEYLGIPRRLYRMTSQGRAEALQRVERLAKARAR